MSEYQFYEFIALDKPLSNQQMAELRAISTRAEITPTRFFNEYHWSDLKADPAKLIAKYFDAHLYFANWGTRRLIFRLPRKMVNVKQLQAYFPDYPAELTVTRSHVIIDLESDTEEPEDDWFAADHLAVLIPLRKELLRGDLRVAYIAWLLAAQSGELRATALEPPVPPGLTDRSAMLTELISFLRIDIDLLQAAAEASTVKKTDKRGLKNWLKSLPEKDKTDWLLRAVDDHELSLGAELTKTFLQSQRVDKDKGNSRRTVKQLLLRAEEVRAARQQKETEQAAKEQVAAQAEREKYLSSLAKQGKRAWQKLEKLVDNKDYDQAVTLTRDLQDVAEQTGKQTQFDERFAEIKKSYSSRRGYFNRLRDVRPKRL